MSQFSGHFITLRRLELLFTGRVKPRLTGKCLKQTSLLALFVFLLLFSLGREDLAQRGGGVTLFGDFKVDESKAEGQKPLSFNILLYSTTSGRVVDRQTVSSIGRYRFLGVPNGEYDLVIEVEENIIARIHVMLIEPMKTEVRQDISLEWRPNLLSRKKEKPAAVSAADAYKRSSTNQTRFDKAEQAVDKKSYEQASSLLRQIVADDPNDFQAWTELGTVYLIQNDTVEAEKAYLLATQLRPTFVLAAVNLGRLRLMTKNYDGAIEILSRAVQLQPPSASANYYLGEAYLQVRKGSKAVGYLNEALRLDPAGMAEAHLRLAALYHAVGMKDKAAAEYEQYLAKRPNSPDKQRLQQYISENKKP